MTQPRAIILSFLSLATSEASSWHEPQATRLPCVSHKECVAERGVTHLQPAETWRNAFQVPIYRPKGDPQHIPVNFLGMVQMNVTVYFACISAITLCKPEHI